MSDKFSIELYTPELPAPHAFAIQLEIEKQGKALQTNFVLQYIDRDSCTKDEILEEGYTGDDNISWQGILNETWSQAFFAILKNLQTESEENEHHIFIKKSNGANPDKVGFTSSEELDYLLKELHQAVLEDLQLELPLSIHIQEYDKGEPIIDLSCIASFLERKAVIMLENAGQNRQIELNWENLSKFMAEIFSHEFDQDKAQATINQPEGMYIETGNDLWIPIKGKAKETIKKAIREIIS